MPAADAPVNRDPVYLQMNDRLRELLRGGDFPPGSQFLTERQVAERFGVSRPTANKTLAALVGEGLLEFRKGIGTFVRAGVLDYDLRRLVSFTDQARAAGRVPSSRVLRLRKSTAGAEGVSAFPPKATVHAIERVRLADKVPVIYERRVVCAELCPTLTRTDLAGSLYALWTERDGLAIVGAKETIRAVVLDDERAAALAVEPGSAALVVEAVGYVVGERPLWWEETTYRADRYEFHNRIGGLASHPASGRLTGDGTSRPT